MVMDTAASLDVLANRGLNKLAGGNRPTEYHPPSDAFSASLDMYTRPPQTPVDKAGEAILSMVAGSKMPAPNLMSKVPANFRTGPGALREGILQAGAREGLVAPPSATNPSAGNRFLEGLAGKLKLGQEAGIRNQPQINRLMSRSVGETSDAPMLPGSLRTIRSEAAARGYEPVRQAGQISTDAKYLTELDAITKTAQGASRSFPGIAKQSPIDDVVGALKQGKFDAGDGIDALAYLRDQADTAYSSGDKVLGKAYKAASKAIEDAIERDLSGRGKDGKALLKNFREARELMAKTFTASKALVGDSGDFNARTVASELARGRPLTGDQKMVGDFAGAFGKYTPKPTGETFPSVSPLDAYGSAIAAGASGSPLPFAYPLTRMGLRNYLLSPAGQARGIQPNKMAPRFMGTAGAFPVAQEKVRGLFAE